ATRPSSMSAMPANTISHAARMKSPFAADTIAQIPKNRFPIVSALGTMMTALWSRVFTMPVLPARPAGGRACRAGTVGRPVSFWRSSRIGGRELLDMPAGQPPEHVTVPFGGRAHDRRRQVRRRRRLVPLTTRRQVVPEIAHRLLVERRLAPARRVAL